MSTPSPPAAPKSRGRLLLWAGVLAALLGLVLYALQLRAAVLVTPWYAPALAVLGTGLILLSLLRRRTVWRGAALLLLAALTLGECWFLYSYASLPDYSGRVGVGDSFPEFTAARADGTPFTRADLVGEQDTVLVFFRGWWWTICRIELGQLEGRHPEFEKRNTRIVAVSLDGLEDSARTQQKFPHLLIVSDEEASLARAADVIAAQHSPTGGDTAAPTTFLIDRRGTVRSVLRRKSYLARVTPAELLAAVEGAFRE